MPAPVFVPAVNSGQRIAEKPVEMDSSVLVVLRYEDVPEPTAADLIVQPVVEVPGDLLDIVAVDFGLIESERDEPAKIVGEREIADRDAGAALRARQRRAASLVRVVVLAHQLIRRLFHRIECGHLVDVLPPRSSSLLRRVAPLLPAALAEDRPVRYQHAPRAVRIGLDMTVVRDMVADLDRDRRRSWDSAVH